MKIDFSIMMKKIWLNINFIITCQQKLIVKTQWKNIDEWNVKKIVRLKQLIDYLKKLNGHKICQMARKIINMLSNSVILLFETWSYIDINFFFMINCIFIDHFFFDHISYSQRFLTETFIVWKFYNQIFIHVFCNFIP